MDLFIRGKKRKLGTEVSAWLKHQFTLTLTVAVSHLPG